MEKTVIIPEHLEQYYWSSDVDIHPTGTKLAYVRKNVHVDNNNYCSVIRTVQLDGTNDKALTSGTSDSQPFWSPNGHYLAFLRITAGVNQLWLIAEDGNDEQLIVETKRSISEWRWLSDSSGIVYVTRIHLDEQQEALSVAEANEKRSKVGASYTSDIPKAEGSGWSDGLYSHIFQYNLQSKTVKQLTAGAFQASQPRPFGDKLAFIARSAKGDDLAGNHPMQGLYVMHATGELQQLVTQQYEIAQYNWSGNGESIIFLAHNREYGSATHNNLYQISLHAGYDVVRLGDKDVQLGVYVLNDMTAGASIPGPYSLRNEADEEEIVALASHHGEVQIWKWSKGEQEQQITDERWVIHQLYASKQADAFVVQAIDDTGPGELYAIDRMSGQTTPLTNWNRDFSKQHEIATPKPIWFTNNEGNEVQGWLLMPSGHEASSSIPLVLAIHGGPHAMYAPVYYHEFQTIVSQGHALLYCNPRGSFGYGQQFAKGCLKDVGKGDYEDLMLAVDVALEREPRLDEQRMAVMGGSYGGLMTNWIVGQTNRFTAAISQRSISNWLSFYGTSDIGARYTEAMLGAHPWNNQALLWERSPVAHANNVQTPILIMHGEQDFRCPIEQSDQWYSYLKRWGKEAKLIRYAGGNHAFQKAGKPSIRIDVLQQVNAWLRTHLHKPVMLGIPLAMLLENCRSSGASDDVIAHCIASKDFSAIAHLTKEPEMPFVERAELAEELHIKWENVFQYGYCFSFLHTNALKRLLLFRYNLVEGEHYIQQEYDLYQVPLHAAQADELSLLIQRQWQLEKQSDGYYISRKVEF